MTNEEITNEEENSKAHQSEIFGKIFENSLSIRQVVLKEALFLEYMTSQFLSSLLGINDYEKTKSFSGSSSLSLSQRFQLLIDIGVLDETTRGKFQAFLEIRNQFMHNSRAINYTTCIQYAKNIGYINKHYPQPKTQDIETQLKNAITALTLDVKNATFNVIEYIKKKDSDALDNHLSRMLEKAYFKGIEESPGKIMNYCEDIIQQNPNTDPDLIKAIAEEVHHIMLTEVMNKLKELTTL